MAARPRPAGAKTFEREIPLSPPDQRAAIERSQEGLGRPIHRGRDGVRATVRAAESYVERTTARSATTGTPDIGP